MEKVRVLLCECENKQKGGEKGKREVLLNSVELLRHQGLLDYSTICSSIVFAFYAFYDSEPL